MLGFRLVLKHYVIKMVHRSIGSHLFEQNSEHFFQLSYIVSIPVLFNRGSAEP